MNAKQFKKILKPLIEQTVRQVLLEEGVLSRVVSEVAQGLSGNVISEARPKDNELQEQYEKRRQEKIKRLNESSRLGGVFKGTKEIASNPGQGPLSGISPADKGVDISAIERLSNGKWKLLAGSK